MNDDTILHGLEEDQEVYNIQLTRQDSIQLVGLLVVLGAIARVHFKNNEPCQTRSSELAQEVLRQLVESDIQMSEAELNGMVKQMSMSELTIFDELENAGETIKDEIDTYELHDVGVALRDLKNELS